MVWHISMASPFPNLYTHRQVASTAAKPCEICSKPSTSVLLASGNKDFFYVCSVHLKDKGFCRPFQKQNSVTAQKNQALNNEILRLKLEYDQKKDKKQTEDRKEQETKEKITEKIDLKGTEQKSTDKKKDLSSVSSVEETKDFVLLDIFYQQRINKKRHIEILKQRNERLLNPNLFPEVPKNTP
ncbi:UPF0589 protein C32H8.01c [Golovinomyces cichoracearum]|uniref:UPF0589 protein C32H8.01c n=1 Tax=Golovinomyces cichoracearum TaxID=62708 RepID=A0A420I4S2_9PEZI|nr:UPF0589 protein C32H8.01c [Golovinomyces cichoracearum]